MSNKKEIQIGEVVIIDGYQYICTENEDFDVCNDTDCDLLNHKYKCEHNCSRHYRTDNKDVIFKLKKE